MSALERGPLPSFTRSPFAAWLTSEALSTLWRRCFTKNGLIDLKIAHREAAKDDLPNARDLLDRGANRGDGDFGCEFYRVPIDPCADAWERKCSKTIRGSELH